MSPFAAVLLAGGQSRRMGQDKALLTLPDGRRLWERQLGVLRELAPAELFISGPAREGFPPDVVRLDDAATGLGPLSGVAVALRAMHAPRLVVLPIDLPAMTAAFLRALLASAGEGGIIPQAADGFYEPLAAVYPRQALALAEDRLRGADRSLQGFVRSLVRNGQAITVPISVAERALFTNWNQPADLLTAAGELQ